LTDSTPTPIIPSVETVEYGRRAIGELIRRYERFETQAAEAGKPDASRRFRAVHAALRRELYGHEDGGCVVTSFDARWLNPEFRAAMTQVRASAQADAR
jgi:hypothetical protein